MEPIGNSEDYDMEDEEDTFLCGRCKSKFTELAVFISHKQNGCSKVTVSASSQSQPLQSTPEQSTSESLATLQPNEIKYSISSQEYITANLQSGGPEPEETPSQPVFRAIVLINENETLTLDIPYDQLQFPPGTCLIQSASADQDASLVLSAPDNELTTLTSILHPEPDENVQTQPHLPSSESIRISPIFHAAPENTEGCYYQDQDGNIINLQYLNDGSGYILLDSGASEDPMIREFNFTPIHMSESPVLSLSPTEEIQLTPAEVYSNDHHQILESPMLMPVDDLRNSSIQSSEAVLPENILDNRNSEAEDHTEYLKCRYCGKYYKTTALLESHVLSHAICKPNHECPLCGRRFKRKSNMRKHLSAHKVWPKLKSTLPKTEIKSDSGDQITTSISNSYSCQYCIQTFASYLDLKSHSRMHKKEKVFKCNGKGCFETFLDVEKLILHTKTHTFVCKQCPDVLPSLQDLLCHERVQHKKLQRRSPSTGQPSPPLKLQCNKCDSKFKTAVGLEHHVLTASHNYPCTYPQCTMVFNTERYLRRHLKLHSNARTFQCDKCTKSFKSQDYLKAHQFTHIETKSFKCEECGTLFSRRDILVRHIRTLHKQPVKLVCPFADICSKEFYRKDKLQDHIWSHSRKVFVCQVTGCQQAFESSVLLRHHQIAEHRELFVQTTCPVCDKVFKTDHHLKIHVCKGKSHSSTSPEQAVELQADNQNNSRNGSPNGPVYLASSPNITRTVRKRSKKQNYVIHRLNEAVLEMPC